MSKARIMVVEDEGVVALQIRETLEVLGYDVPVVALSGEEALAKVQESEPDLVLMDIQLGGGTSGTETARRIRQRLDVPVVYLTAYCDEETLGQAALTEPYAYVLKPFDEKSLHAIIQMSLMKHRRTREARETGWWMSAVAASMMEAVLICDPKGYVQFLNPPTESLIGRGQRELLGKRLHEVVSLVDRQTGQPLSFPVTEPILEGHSTLRGNCLLLAAEGREVPVELSASPLRSPEGTLFGVLYVLRESTARVQDLALQELQEVARIQREILPERGASLEGVRLDWLFMPTGSGGGDILDCFLLDEGTIAFYAAEIVGQGSIPVLFSLLLRARLSAHPERGGMLTEKAGSGAGQRVLQPAEVVRELNRRFYLRDEAAPCFTIAYGLIQPSSGAVRLVRAGHPYPLHVRADGTSRLLQSEGDAVGLFPNAEVATEKLQLTAGDRLALYSDGLVDCANPAGERFGTARLAAHFAAHRRKPLVETVEALRQLITSWRGSPEFSDDVSVLVLEKE
jgi:PAS domain S-box-containing protein